jgi:hypothetical protein
MARQGGKMKPNLQDYYAYYRFVAIEFYEKHQETFVGVGEALLLGALFMVGLALMAIV